MSGAKSLHKTSRSEDAAYEIARLIFDGSLRPGQRLIEEELARQLNVSRVPVREALRELSREGLVEVFARRGAFVARMDRAEVSETYDVRALLEGFAARLCAEQITPKQVLELEGLLAEMRHAVSDGAVDRYSGLALQFTELICEYAPNRVLRELVHQLGRRSRKLRLIAMRLPGRAEQSLASNERLFDAIRKRDSRAAEMLRWLYVQQAKQALMSGYFGEAQADRRTLLERDLPDVDLRRLRPELAFAGARTRRRAGQSIDDVG